MPRARPHVRRTMLFMVRHDASALSTTEWTAYAAAAYDSFIDYVKRGVERMHATNEILASFPH